VQNEASFSYFEADRLVLHFHANVDSTPLSVAIFLKNLSVASLT
jgi:hypothetical protein